MQALAINADGDVFAGTYGRYGGVYRSKDNGENWTPVNTGLPANTGVAALVINSQGDIFAGMEEGVFRSQDNGETWTAVNTGLPANSALRNIQALAINADGDVFAGTNGAGVFRSVESTLTAVEETERDMPVHFALEQNYPNPFNPVTVIRYALPTPQHVTLRVYDVLGREVARLVDGQQRAGRYAVDFEAGGLSSGVYLYRLVAGHFSDTRQLIILR